MLGPSVLFLAKACQIRENRPCQLKTFTGATRLALNGELPTSKKEIKANPALGMI
jgi:hypothetical protein